MFFSLLTLLMESRQLDHREGLNFDCGGLMKMIAFRDLCSNICHHRSFNTKDIIRFNVWLLPATLWIIWNQRNKPKLQGYSK